MGVEPRDGELGAVGQSKLVEHRADAVAHGALAQIQSGGDVAVVESLGDERRDVTLSFVQQLIDAIRRTTAVRDAVAGRVRGVVRPLASGTGRRPGEFADHVGAEHHLTGHHRMQGGCDRRHILLDEIAFRPEPHRLLDIGLVRERGQEQDTCRRILRQDLPRGIQPVHAGHLYVDEQDIRMILRRLEMPANRRAAIVGAP